MTNHFNALRYTFLACFVLLMVISSAFAGVDTYRFNTEAQETQYHALINEFRCPTCQNQNLAGSDAPLAKDLKRTTYEQVLAGKTDAEIRDYMVARYGDFISYKPPVNANTALLWFLPPVFLCLLLLLWFFRYRTRLVDFDGANSNQIKPASGEQVAQGDD